MLMFYLQMIETEEDRSKFEKLYLEYRGLMYKVSHDILNHNEDSEDAVHQAFVYVAENIRKIETDISAKTKSYLVTLAECRALNIKNLRERRREVDFEEAYGIAEEYTGTDNVSKCISKLPARYREVLTLKHRHGFDNKSIAKMMSTTEANVRKLEQRGRAKLFEICRKEGVL